MPRKLRPLLAGATYHVTSRGNERREIARDDTDWQMLTRLLDEVVRARAWEVQSYCYMPNHIHLLVRTPEPDLSDGMQQVLGGYGRRFNDRHERTGHLFQGRFYSGEVTSDIHHMQLFRYLAMNPVRAGIVPAPELWPWSAHLPFMRLAAPPDFLDLAMSPFGGDTNHYAAFIRDAARTYLRDLVGDLGAPGRLRLALDAGFSQRQIAVELRVRQQEIARRVKGV